MVKTKKPNVMPDSTTLSALACISKYIDTKYGGDLFNAYSAWRTAAFEEHQTRLEDLEIAFKNNKRQTTSEEKYLSELRELAGLRILKELDSIIQDLRTLLEEKTMRARDRKILDEHEERKKPKDDLQDVGLIRQALRIDRVSPEAAHIARRNEAILSQIKTSLEANQYGDYINSRNKLYECVAKEVAGVMRCDLSKKTAERTWKTFIESGTEEANWWNAYFNKNLPKMRKKT